MRLADVIKELRSGKYPTLLAELESLIMDREAEAADRELGSQAEIERDALDCMVSYADEGRLGSKGARELGSLFFNLKLVEPVDISQVHVTRGKKYDLKRDGQTYSYTFYSYSSWIQSLRA